MAASRETVTVQPLQEQEWYLQAKNFCETDHSNITGTNEFFREHARHQYNINGMYLIIKLRLENSGKDRDFDELKKNFLMIKDLLENFNHKQPPKRQRTIDDFNNELKLLHPETSLANKHITAAFPLPLDEITQVMGLENRNHSFTKYLFGLCLETNRSFSGYVRHVIEEQERHYVRPKSIIAHYYTASQTSESEMLHLEALTALQHFTETHPGALIYLAEEHDTAGKQVEAVQTYQCYLSKNPAINIYILATDSSAFRKYIPSILGFTHAAPSDEVKALQLRFIRDVLNDIADKTQLEVNQQSCTLRSLSHSKQQLHEFCRQMLQKLVTAHYEPAFLLSINQKVTDLVQLAKVRKDPKLYLLACFYQTKDEALNFIQQQISFVSRKDYQSYVNCPVFQKLADQHRTTGGDVITYEQLLHELVKANCAAAFSDYVKSKWAYSRISTKKNEESLTQVFFETIRHSYSISFFDKAAYELGIKKSSPYYGFFKELLQSGIVLTDDELAQVSQSLVPMLIKVRTPAAIQLLQQLLRAKEVPASYVATASKLIEGSYDAPPVESAAAAFDEAEEGSAPPAYTTVTATAAETDKQKYEAEASAPIYPSLYPHLSEDAFQPLGETTTTTTTPPPINPAVQSNSPEPSAPVLEVAETSDGEILTSSAPSVNNLRLSNTRATLFTNEEAAKRQRIVELELRAADLRRQAAELEAEANVLRVEVTQLANNKPKHRRTMSG